MPANRNRRRRRPKLIKEITIKQVNLLKAENEKSHFTQEYESGSLVLRRGFPFKLLITFANELKVTPEFELRTGSRPNKSRKSLVSLPPVDPKINEDVEGTKIISSNGKLLSLEIFTSAKRTPIGCWSLVMKMKKGRRKIISQITPDLILLFNPWCIHDSVYMEKDEWRQEYVLNEEGLQFYGSSRSIGSMDWFFGQFDSDVLQASLKLISKTSSNHRHDPVEVTRSLSALVNSQDDQGVLVGNWSGDYRGGSSPSEWNSSSSILRKYNQTNQPVKYGQCWVFSGVLTAVTRCLGIPSRSITNFNSAHDTDGNLTIDYHFDKNGNPEDNDDSVWNFHVWNDVWMARDDLPEGFGGWQAIDATPQETSDGVYQCGPASLQALKQGKIDLNFDAKFIYAEVNASKKFWKRSEDDGDWLEAGSDIDVIGRKISTKAIGYNWREDITKDYKFDEGTSEERLSFEMAKKFANFTHTEKPASKKDLQIRFDLPESLEFGKDLNFKIQVENMNSNEIKKVYLVCSTKTMQYNGSLIKQIDTFKKEVEIQPTDPHQDFQIQIPASDYINRTADSLKLSVLCGVRESREVYAIQDIVVLKKPQISIQPATSASVGKLLKVQLSLTNPLSTSLSGHFHLEGAGTRDSVIVEVGEILPLKTCSVEARITPKKSGQRRLVVGFVSEQIAGVKGACDLNIES